MRRTVTDFEIIDHGIYFSDCFQGCGVCLTDFEDVATGIGEDFAEALDDALESLAQSGWNVEEVSGKGRTHTVTEYLAQWKEDGDDDDDDTEHPWYHVSVRVKGEPTEPGEDDYTTEDYREFYQNGKLVLTVPEQERWEPYVRAHMDREQFWPNVWAISDHGNIELLTIIES